MTRIHLQRHTNIGFSHESMVELYFKEIKNYHQKRIYFSSSSSFFFLFSFISCSVIIFPLHICILVFYRNGMFIEYRWGFFFCIGTSINWFMVSHSNRKYGYMDFLNINAILKCTYSELRFEMLHLQRVECHYLPHKRSYRYELDSHALYLLYDHV